MITWLASYPKSGNTWIRMFLDAYLRDADPDINSVRTSCSDNMTAFHKVHNKIKVEDLPLEEQLLTRPMALLRLNYLFDEETVLGQKPKGVPLLVKTHNANVTVLDVRMIPPQITKKVLLVLRDPRKLVYSFAKHFGLSLEDAVDSICKKDYALDGQTGTKMIQYLMSWGWHTQSYITADDLDVAVVRYEDLVGNPLNNFIWILKQLDLEADEEKVKLAIERCELSRLMKQEDKNGFKEASEKAKRFFGAKYEERLTQEQKERIEEECGEMMRTFKYLEEEKAA